MSESKSDKSTKGLFRALRLMALIAMLTLAYVILRSCSTPKRGLDSFGQGSLSKLQTPASASALPNLAFTDPDGQVRKLRDIEDKVLLINFWGTWCPPCIKELPSLVELQRLRGGDDFEVVLVNLDRTADLAQAFLERNALTDVRTWFDSSYGALKAYELKGFPTTILYTYDKMELVRILGEADWASQEALDLIDYAVSMK